MSQSASACVACTPQQFKNYIISFEGNAVACIFTGIYLSIAWTNIHLLLLKKKYKILLLYTIIQLAITTLQFTISLYAAPAQSLATLNLTDPSAPATLSAWPQLTVDITFVLNNIITQAFLLYRCYVICLGNKYALTLSLILYLAATGSSFAWLIVSSPTPGIYFNTQGDRLTAICLWACGTAMNIQTSYLICVRLWTHRRAISDALGSTHSSFYLGYISMTIESALLTAVFGAVVGVTYLLDHQTLSFFLAMYTKFLPIAPSLIICRIARGISFETDDSGITTMGDIRFAPLDQSPEIAQSAPKDVQIIRGSDESAEVDQGRSDVLICERET